MGRLKKAELRGVVILMQQSSDKNVWDIQGIHKLASSYLAAVF